MAVWIEVAGWAGTAMFLSSFLVKRRSVLHGIGCAACILKIIYSYHYAVWPLFANWAVLVFVEAAQAWRYSRSEGPKKT